MWEGGKDEDEDRGGAPDTGVLQKNIKPVTMNNTKHFFVFTLALKMIARKGGHREVLKSV